MTTETRNQLNAYGLLPMPVRVHSLNNWASHPERNEIDGDTCAGPISVQYGVDDVVRSGQVIAWACNENGVKAVVELTSGRLVERSVYQLQTEAAR